MSSVIDLYVDEKYQHGTACYCSVCRPLREALALSAQLEAQRDSARRLAAHAFSRLCAAEDLLRACVTEFPSAAAEEAHGARIQSFLEEAQR